MKKIILLAAFVLAAASASQAVTPSCNSLSGDAVVNGSTSAGGTIGGNTSCYLQLGSSFLVLQGWAYQYFNSAPIFNAAGAGGFNVFWNPNTVSGGSSDAHFTYEVSSVTGTLGACSADSNGCLTVTGNAGLILSVSLHTSGGDPGSHINEDVCDQSQVTSSGAPIGAACSPGNQLAFMQVTNSSPNANANLSPGSNPVFAWKDIGPGNTGFSQDFTVPEPGTLVLMGGGLLGLAGMLRRKLRS
jgi:hypothetical protein